MNYAKRAVLVLLVLYISSKTSAQSCTGIFEGEVLDKLGHPLVGAAITLSSPAAGISTDTSGKFYLDKLCFGDYTATIQYLGFKSKTIKFSITGKLKKTILLEEELNELREVVIHERADNTEHAHNLAVLTEQQLAESAGKALGETLKEISGVNTIQSGPGIFKPVIHGVHSQRVLILNHGIRQEGQQWGAEHAPEIDPFIASTIVVVKDASSIKYGTDALGGVIVVNPPDLPEDTGISGSVNSVLQSNGRSGTLSGMIEGGVKNHKGWGWRIQGTGKRAGDFHTPHYNLTNTGIQELNFSTAAAYHNEAIGVEAYFSHFESDLGILKGISNSSIGDLKIAMEREPPQYTSSFRYTLDEPRQHVRHNLLKLNGHIPMGKGEFRFQYGFQNNSRQEFDIRKDDRSKIPSIDLQLSSHSFETEWETGQAEKRTLCIGATSLLQKNNNIPNTQRIPFIPNFSATSAGVFAITKFYTTRWVIDLGTRYDYRYYSVKGFDVKNQLYGANLYFNNASATVGATLQINKQQTLNLNLSSAWRPPHIAELYSAGTHQSAGSIEYGLLLTDSSEVMDLQDAMFKTEQAVKYVSTYHHEWKVLKLELSPYVNYIFNYIYLQPRGIRKTVRGVSPYFHYTQTDALFLGVDLSATWQLTNYLKATSKASWLRASDQRNHDYLVFIPSNRYEAAIRYEKPSLKFIKNLFIESKIKFIARQSRAPRVITPPEIEEAEKQNIDLFKSSNDNFDFMAAPSGYTLFSTAIGVSIKRDKIRYDFRVAGENLFNTSYREYTNRLRYYADDIGRNFILSIKCIF
jgi:iron complex outermembrane receptor protein